MSVCNKTDENKKRNQFIRYNDFSVILST